MPLQKRYDLVVIGSGPGGHRAAVQAAKLGKKVLVVERDRMGGACLHLGTIPSKSLREAALAAEAGKTRIADIMSRTHRVIHEEQDIIEEHFRRNHCEAVIGTASFIDAHTVVIDLDIASGEHGRNTEGHSCPRSITRVEVKADFVIIATGTRPRRPADLVFDDVTLFDSDSILRYQGQPRTLLVLGGGVIGCEYASIFARMGVKVTLVDSRPELLPSIDREIVEALIKQYEKSGVEVELSTQAENLTSVADGPSKQAQVELIKNATRRTERFDVVLYCLGRVGNYESLNLAAIGLQPDNRGQLNVDSHYRTQVANVYAVGDLIGAPALAASSSEQGRLAALHAFTGQCNEFPDTFPYGIYTIPEISSVGVLETQLAARSIPYVVGKAPYKILARGKMLEDEFGFLKLVVHVRTRRIVGVHVIGTSATELVHIGQVAMAFGATVDFFVDNVFNYPTLAEAYKVAAYHAANKLDQLDDNE